MDSLLLKERRIQGTAVCIAVVCDGVGSLTNGAFASSAAVQMLSEWFSSLNGLQRLGLQMRDCVLKINRHIVQEAREWQLHTGTTLSTLLLADKRYYIVHTGDSRIYLSQNGFLKQLTEDQSSGGRLTACLGHGEKAELYYNEGGYQDGCFLLCSDGLYKRMDLAFLQAELEKINSKNMRTSIEKLIRFVTSRGESDNISLAIVQGKTEGGPS